MRAENVGVPMVSRAGLADQTTLLGDRLAKRPSLRSRENADASSRMVLDRDMKIALCGASLFWLGSGMIVLLFFILQQSFLRHTVGIDDEPE